MNQNNMDGQTPARRLSPLHRRYVLRETLLSLVINATLSVLFALLVAHGNLAIPLWGPGGMALDFVPQTFMISFATAIDVTLTSRQRLRAGAVKPLARSEAGPFARLPHNVLARALLIAATAAIVLSPISAGALQAFEVTRLPANSFVVMKVLYGAMVTLLIGPPVVRAAMVL
jgi:hypothetical protein